MAVKQIGQTGLAFSKESSGYWVELRQSKDALKQIAGLLAAGNSTQAVNAAKGYLSSHPQDVQGIMYLATALAMDKKYHLAAYYAQAGLRLRPGDGMLLNVLGVSSYLGSIRSAKEVSESLAILKQSFQGNSSQIASGLNLGGIYLELGNPAEAKVYYQEVAKRCGNCTMSLMGSGTASLRQKKFAEAKSAFEKILTKEPFHGAALFNLAVVYRNGFQNRAQAEKYLFTLLNRSGKSDMALRSRAQAFLRMMKGELNQGQRSLAGEESRSKAKGKSQGKGPGDDTSDAELLMTSGDGLGK
jgi:tetratricopeptide (TPR) repeat protein